MSAFLQVVDYRRTFTTERLLPATEVADSEIPIQAKRLGAALRRAWYRRQFEAALRAAHGARTRSAGPV